MNDLELSIAIRKSLYASIKIKNAMGPGADRDAVETKIDEALGWLFKGKLGNAGILADDASSMLANMALS